MINAFVIFLIQGNRLVEIGDCAIKFQLIEERCTPQIVESGRITIQPDGLIKVVDRFVGGALHLVGEAAVFERIYEFGVSIESACEVRDGVVEVALPELGHPSIVVGGRNIGSFGVDAQ